MQLKPKSVGVRRKLIAASCTLLSASAARSQDAATPIASSAASDWIADSALAYYHENNGRVQAIEPVVHLRKDFGDEHSLNLKFTFDSLSGSSPNGALPSTKPQTFASPSGNSLSATPQTYTTASGHTTSASAPIYTVAPGELPMDPNYSDLRVAVAGDWRMPLTRLIRATIGGGFSYEHDFFSTSVNASLARDFNQKNTTLSIGVSDEFDSLRPIGGAPVAGSDYALFQKTDGKNKNGAGLLLGLTQVMNRQWLSEFNLSIDRFTGYLNDPYKIVSIIDNTGNTTGYLYEKRPDSRTRKSVYLENRVAWDRATATLSLRYMTDDWGVHSQTSQLGVRWWNSDHDRYLEPTVRWYKQSAANFYAPWISSTDTQYVDSASADTRLGAFHALTFGLKYAVKSSSDLDSNTGEWSVRLEYYQQVVDDRFAVPTALSGLDLYPGLKAIMLQVGWRFGF